MQYVIEQYGWKDGCYSLMDSKLFTSLKPIEEKSYVKNGYTFCINKVENEVQNTRRRRGKA